MPDFEISEIINSVRYGGIRPAKLPRDTVEYYDITFLTEGRLSYKIDGAQVEMYTGDAICFPPGSVRERARGKQLTSYMSFNFTLRENCRVPLRGVLNGAVTPWLRELLDAFFSLSSPYKKEKERALLTALIYELIGAVETSGNEAESIIRIRNYIKSHLAEHLSLDTIAQSVHLHPSYCCNLFKKRTGTTIFGYINTIRMQAAKRHLRANDIILEDVAGLCGFTNYKYFARTFKKETGMSPTAYRKSAKTSVSEFPGDVR